MPNEPILDSVVAGAEIAIYIGRHLAFTGSTDRRHDQSHTLETSGTDGAPAAQNKEPSGPSLNIGPNAYTVTLQCRGKAKKLVDASHLHPTGTIVGTSNRDAVEPLVKPFGVNLDSQALTTDLNRVRFRDGARVVDLGCRRLITEWDRDARFLDNTLDRVELLDDR